MSQIPLTYAHPAFTGLIGVAREDITPPVGIYARNWGAAAHDVAEGIHQPLTLTTLTLQSSPTEPPLVLIVADLGWWRSAQDEWALRSAVLDKFSLDPARLMISLTHTHAGPALCREDGDKPGGHLIGPYLDRLREAALHTTWRAMHTRQPASLDWTTGRCNLATNRDLPDPEHPRYVCGFRPDGPADDTLLIGRVRLEDGKPFATLVNYACHPTTLAWENHLISPDFVGTMRETVEGQTGGAPCLFLQGASGELAPREQYNVKLSRPYYYGRQLGFAAVSALEGMLPPLTRIEYTGVVESGAPLALWKRAATSPSVTLEARRIEIELPLKPMPTAAELTAQIAQSADRVQAERLLRKRRIRESVGDGTTAKIPAWAWRVGDALLVGHPNEAYSLLQRELRRAFPDYAVAVMNVVNGHSGYLPPADLYDENIYQVWQTPFDRGSLERVIADTLAALHALTE